MPLQVNEEGKIISIPETIKTRSDSVEELISTRPGYLLRFGITVFFFMLLLICFVCWFIKYPDVVPVKAKLNSINPPKPVVSQSGGILVKLNVKEGDLVKKGQILGYLESTGNHDEVLSLSKSLDSLNNYLLSNSVELLPKTMTEAYSNLGELQPLYQQFMQSFFTFRNYLSDGFYLKKKDLLNYDLNNLHKLHEILLQQKVLQDQDMALSEKTFEVNQSLKDEKVITDLDYRNEKSKFINKKLSLPQINASIVSNESQQNEKHKEIMELDNQIKQQKTFFQQSLYTFKSQVEAWKFKYMLIAPTEGKVAFTTFLQENQQVTANRTVCYINPNNTEYYSEIFIPQTNFAKVTIGQKVLLKLPSYPSHEYGILQGKLNFISDMPTDSGYIAKVILPNGLKTNYNKVIYYKEGLIAQGEIVTRDMRLLQRFYYNLIHQLKD